MTILAFCAASQTNKHIKVAMLDTYHHVGTAAEADPIVIGGDNFELEVGPAHVSKHYGGLDDPCVRLDDKAVLALCCWWDNEAVRHGAVIPGVLIGSLQAHPTC